MFLSNRSSVLVPESRHDRLQYWNDCGSFFFAATFHKQSELTELEGFSFAFRDKSGTTEVSHCYIRQLDDGTMVVFVLTNTLNNDGSYELLDIEVIRK